MSKILTVKEGLFRGKKLGENEWVYGSLIKDAFPFGKNDMEYRSYIATGSMIKKCDLWYLEKIRVADRTVGQIRFKISGLELYDGDVVEMEYTALNKPFKIKGVVEYRLSKGQTLICERDGFLSRCVSLSVNVINIKKIGNKFDNPELLEAKNE